MKNEIELKPFDKVLVRDKEADAWQIDIFEKYEESFSGRWYSCLVSLWQQCIPYEGNEHLLGATDEPERYDTDKNTLFGVKLNPGYVLEFEDDEVGILFPTANGFAVSYVKGVWQFLEGIKKDSILRIKGITQTDYLRSGETLWERPQKQTLTKAQIAEKLGISEQDFEIVDEENK